MIANRDHKGFMFIGQKVSFLEYTDMIICYFFSEVRAGEFNGEITLDVPTSHIDYGV